MYELYTTDFWILDCIVIAISMWYLLWSE